VALYVWSILYTAESLHLIRTALFSVFFFCSAVGNGSQGHVRFETDGAESRGSLKSGLQEISLV
jgi:hypothetical protein